MKNSENIHLTAQTIESSSSKDTNEKIIDKIIENGYFTKYPIFITISIFITFIANGFVVNIFNLIIIPAKQYFKASDFIIEIMAGILFIGLALGSGLASILSEKYGRAKIIKLFSGVMCITYLISTIFFNLYIFLFSRIILGLCVGIIEPLIFNTFGEYLPIKFRGFLLMNSWFFYTLAVFLENIIALKIMPYLESEFLQRYLLVINIFFILNFIVNYFILNDSPRNLIIKSIQEKNFYERESKIQEALKILNSMNKIPLSKIDEQKLISQLYNLSSNKSKTNSSFKELFSQKYLRTTYIGIFIFFVYSCGYFGFYIISTLTLEILNKKENEKIVENINKNSNKDILISQIYIAFFDLLGSFVGGFLAEIRSIGRKGVIWIFMLLNAITLIPSCINVSLYNIFFTVSITSSAIYGDMLITYISEIFPTKLRDISSSFFLTSHRISGFLSQFLFLGLFKINYKLPFIFGSLLNILGLITIFRLPYESIGRPLDYEEVVEQRDNNQIEF